MRSCLFHRSQNTAEMYSHSESFKSGSFARIVAARSLILFLTVSIGAAMQGCASSGTGQAQVEASGQDPAASVSPAAQAALPREHADSQGVSQPLAKMKKEREVKALNQKIAMESFTTGIENTDAAPDRESYTVGPGDVLEIAVFQVEELNRKVRVTGDGYIMIPLLGGVHVEGKTTTEIEAILTRDLGATYLQNPQISVFIDEFKSHQVAVVGAVNEPSIFSIQKPRTVLEMLAQAGGLTEKAGTRVQVRRTVFNEETKKREKETLIMDLNALLMSGDQRLDVVLRGGDSIVVPEAGSFFIEGAVEKPGAYEMRGNTNVLKALAMSGGILFETSKQQIEVYRESLAGEDEVFQIDYDKIRVNPADDLILEEGDIIVVHHSSFKRGVANFWKGVTGIFRFAL